MDKSGCTRAKDISKSNSLIFDIHVDRLLNTQISECAKSIRGAKLMSPNNLEDSDDHG